MKKIITTLAIALSVVTVAEAQTQQVVAKPTPEAKLISSEVVGSNLVNRWLVREDSSGEGDFSIRYQINIAQMATTFNNNSEELSRLREFMSGITNDNMRSITRVDISGYASPDGVESANKKLAMARADNCKAYIKSHYPSLANIPINTKAVAQTWSDSKSAISKSSIPDKANVLNVINSSTSGSTIESRLRNLTSPWRYIVNNILPPMRYVEVEITYENWLSVETITPVEVVGEVVVVEPNGNGSVEVVDEVVVIEPNGAVEVVDVLKMYPKCYTVIDQYQPDVMLLYNNYFAPIDFEDQYGGKRSKLKFRERRKREKLKYIYR